MSTSFASTTNNQTVYGRQIAFVAAFLLPAAKLLEAPSLLAKYALGDLLLPALLHFLLQSLLLALLLFLVCDLEEPLIHRLRKKWGKGISVFYLLYALYFLFAAILPLLDVEKFIYAVFYDTEPTVFTFAFFFVLSGFVCTKGLRAVGRCADICLFLFLVPFLALLFMALPETDFSHLLPLFGTNFPQSGVAFKVTTPHFSDVVLLLPLLLEYQPKKKEGRKILLGYAVGAVCILVFLAIFFSLFSAIAPREHYAFAKIAQYFPALSVIGRIDLIFVYLLSVVLLFYTCLPLQYATDYFTKALGIKHRVFLASFLNFSFFLFTLFFNRHYNAFYAVITQNLPIVFLFIADMVPLFLLFFTKSTKKQTPI